MLDTKNQEYFNESITCTGILRVFFTVVAVLMVGFTFLQTTSGVSPLWLTPQEAKELLDKTTDVVVIDIVVPFLRQWALARRSKFAKVYHTSSSIKLGQECDIFGLQPLDGCPAISR